MNKKGQLAFLVGIIILILIVIGAITLLGNKEKTGEVIKDSAKDCGDGTVLLGETCWQKSVKPTPAANWQDASDYCESLKLGNKEDWRLPSLAELRSIVKIGAPNEVTIDTELFSDTKPGYFWTSTPYSQKEGNHWFVYFRNGNEDITLDFKSGYEVRCVRDN